MELFATKKVFSSELVGKAIRVKGHDQNGDKVDRLYIVKANYLDHILVTSQHGNEWTFHIEEIENGNPERLTITVLKEEAE